MLGGGHEPVSAPCWRFAIFYFNRTTQYKERFWNFYFKIHGMSVEELIKNLKDLQAVDKEIFALRKDLADLPGKLKELDADLERESGKTKSREEALKALQLKRKEKELDLEQKENLLNKLQTQLYQVKTNSEYSAIEKEISGGKADKSILEEEILDIFDQIEGAEKELSGEKILLDKEKKRVAEEKIKIDSERKAFEERLSELNGKRDSITPLIDKDTLGKYERILNGKEGLALVPVVGENCGGCFMNLPPQIINEIRSLDHIIYCERCSRMLYIEGD